MKSIVIGLFDNKSRAKTVTKELAGAGFKGGDIHLANSGSEFKAAIAGANMTLDETDYFIGEIKQGAAAVAAETSPERAKQAMQIMRSHNAKVAELHAEREMAFPVIEEELRIGKRMVEHGGIRIYSHVTQRPVQRTVHLREEKINVKHRQVDRLASEQDMGMFREVRVELVNMSEEPVVTKEPHVVEEVIISKEIVDHPKTIRGTLRRANVEVKRLPEAKRKRATAQPAKKTAKAKTAAARHGRR